MPEKSKMIPMLFETVKIMEKLVHSMKRLLKNKSYEKLVNILLCITYSNL